MIKAGVTSGEMQARATTSGNVARDPLWKDVKVTCAVVVSYSLIIALFIWPVDGVQSVVYPSNLNIGLRIDETDRAFGKVFLILIPIATIIAATVLRWRRALLLPIAFLFVSWQALVPCARCESLYSSYELALVAWALLVVLPIAVLAATPFDRGIDHEKVTRRSTQLYSMIAYGSLVFVTSAGPLEFNGLFEAEASLTGELSTPILFAAVSSLGSFVTSLKVERRK